MTTNDVPRNRNSHAVHIDIDVAERLVKASALHAQGALTDAEFHELRERLLTSNTASNSDRAT